MIVKSINLIPEAPIADMVAVAQRAESLGFNRCWVYDEGLATRDVYVTMAAIVAGTSTLAVGPGITNPYTRHPGQTASAIASLDEMSGGRAFLGIGAGGSLTLDPLTIERHKPLTAVADTIAACRALFSGYQTSFEGQHVQLNAARLSYARPDLEIWLAGRGPRMLNLGGAEADGVMLDFIHQPSLADYTERVRAGAKETGRRARICYSTAIVTDHDDLEFVRPHMTYRLVDAPQSVKDAIGLGPDDVGRIRRAMKAGLDVAAHRVRDEWIEPFIISGSIASCTDQLGRLIEEHGFEEFLLPIFEMPDTFAYLDRISEVLNNL